MERKTGEFIHNTESPLGEAKSIFDTTEDTGVSSIVIVYGLGLGYVFQYFAQNSKGTVILYEPNLDILRTSFQLVDFSAELKKDNVHVTVDKAELDDIVRVKFNLNSYPQMVCIPSYKQIFKEQIDADIEAFRLLIGGISLDYNYTANRYFNVTCSILYNLPYLVKEPPLCAIKDVYKGKTAVVCSAGPTLAENIETIKKYRDNIVLLAVGPAFKSLQSAGIDVDFLCAIEARNSSGQIAGLDLSKANVILEPYTYRDFHKMSLGKAKNVFSHISNNLPPNRLWTELSGYSNEEYICKGTVSYCALNSARILGCSKIVLVGQDLAFMDGYVYSKDSVYNDLRVRFDEETGKYEVYAVDIDRYSKIISQNSDESVRLERAQERIDAYNSKLTTIKGIQGELLPTEVVYTTFVMNIGKYTQEHPGPEYINTSMRGALIEGFKNMTLEEALKDSEKVEHFEKFDFELCDMGKIKEKLELWMEKLNFAKNRIAENQRILVKFRTDYLRHKTLTKDMLLYLKRMMSNYINLSVDFAQEFELYDFLSKQKQIEFENFLKEAVNIDLGAALAMAELQKEYLDYVTEKIPQAEGRINRMLQYINGEDLL